MQLLDRATAACPVLDVLLLPEGGQHEHPDPGRDVLQRRANDINVLAPGLVIVGKNYDVGAAQKCAVLGLPFPGPADAAGRRHVPRPQQINLGFAFDNNDPPPVRDRVDQFWEPIGNNRHSVRIPDPVSGPFRVGSLLPKGFFVLAVFSENEAAVCVAIFDALDRECDGAEFVEIREFSDDDLSRFGGGIIFSVGLGLRRRLAD